MLKCVGLSKGERLLRSDQLARSRVFQSLAPPPPVLGRGLRRGGEIEGGDWLGNKLPGVP